MVKATLKNYRQSPRKVKTIVDEVRGKTASEAITKLTFIPNRAALPVKKLIESAVANAKHNHNMDPDTLFIKSIVVDEGFSMKRWMPKARGTAHPFRKRTSQVRVVLDGEEAKGKAKKEDKKESKKAVSDDKSEKNRNDIPEAPKKEFSNARDSKSIGSNIKTRTTNK